MMTVDDLIRILQEASEDGKGNNEVRLAIQPNYPLQSSIKGVYIPGDCDSIWEEDDKDDDLNKKPEEECIWICEESQIKSSPYANKEWFETCLR